MQRSKMSMGMIVVAGVRMHASVHESIESLVAFGLLGRHPLVERVVVGREDDRIRRQKRAAPALRLRLEPCGCRGRQRMDRAAPAQWSPLKRLRLLYAVSAETALPKRTRDGARRGR